MDHNAQTFDTESVEAALLARNFFRVTMIGFVAFVAVSMKIMLT